MFGKYKNSKQKLSYNFLTGCLMHKCLYDNTFKCENCTLVSNIKLAHNLTPTV